MTGIVQARSFPPPPDHDGIKDIFVEKASVVLYWHGGRWVKLQGADDTAGLR